MFQNIVFYIKNKTQMNAGNNVFGEYYTVSMPGTQVFCVKREKRIRRRCMIRLDYGQQVKELRYQDTDLKQNEQTTGS